MPLQSHHVLYDQVNTRYQREDNATAIQTTSLAR